MMDDHRDDMYADYSSPLPPIKERKPKRKLLEKDIQKQCVAWARERGWWARKFSSPANRSVPDYLFSKVIDGAQMAVAVEFKVPGKMLTDAQYGEHARMKDAGWCVIIFSDVENFKEYFRSPDPI